MAYFFNTCVLAFVEAQKSDNVMDLPLIFTLLRIFSLRVYTLAHC